MRSLRSSSAQWRHASRGFAEGTSLPIRSIGSSTPHVERRTRTRSSVSWGRPPCCARSSARRAPLLTLLTELEAYPGARVSEDYPVLLAAMIRAAMRIGDRELAERLVADLEPWTPYAKHALVAAEAAITEADGDFHAAAEAYADAADRWERFGVVPEQAFALLGQGRCLLGLSRPTEAAPVFQHAREIFERLRAAPALAETDALLAAGDRAQLMRAAWLVNTWSRSRRNQTGLPGTPVTPQYEPCAAEAQVRGSCLVL